MAGDERRDRLLAAASQVLDAAPDKRMNIVLLNKALFYADILALRDFGTTITRNTYVALKMGPVVAKYDRRLVKAMETAGLARQLVVGMAKPLELTGAPQRGPLTDVEIDLARAVSSILGDSTSTEASAFSHDNPAWRIAYEAGLGSGGPVRTVNLILAMQQVVDADPWLDEEDSDTAEALSRVGADPDEQWD